MNLVNLNRFPAGITLATDKLGHEHVLAVAKATFTILPSGACVLSRAPQPLTFADEHFGEPGLSSVRYESDFALGKPRVDVLVNGSAITPQGKPSDVLDVSLDLGPIRKSIRVFGNRIWKPNLLLGYSPSDPVPFTRMPLVYERAFGGVDRSDEDEARHVPEEHNLVGVGFHARAHPSIAGAPLPNLEDPHKLISSPFDRPKPAGFGILARHWFPRRRFAGTYDDAWKKERFPFLPLDFDPQFNQSAPEDQRCDPLRGGEKVVLAGMHSSGRLSFTLPSLRVPVKLVYFDRREDLESVLDTVLLEPNESRFMMVWRASTRLRGKPTDLRQIWVGQPTRARLRALESEKQFVDWTRRRNA